MPMIRTEFGRWTHELDASLTFETYSQIQIGASESCGCAECLNFAAQRSIAFPRKFRDFLALAGISVDREAEIYHNSRLDSGLHSYGGWFHFVGKIISGSDAFVAIDERSGAFDLNDRA